MAVTLVQLGPRTAITGASLSPTLSAASTAGNTLVCTVSAFGSTPPGCSGPAGWVRVAQGSTSTATATNRSEVWMLNPSGDRITGGNAGGITTAGPWACAGATAMRATLFELTGAAALRFDNGGGWGTLTAATVFPGTFCPSAAGFAVGSAAASFSVAPTGAWTYGGWTQGRSNASTGSSEAHFYNPTIAAGFQTWGGGYNQTANGTGESVALASFTDVAAVSSPVYDVGNATAGGGAATTLNVPLIWASAGNNTCGPLLLPAVGDLIYVIAGYSSSSGITSCTDSQGQTYPLGPLVSSSSSQRIAIFTLINTKVLTAADSITITYAAAAGGKAAIVKGCRNVASASWTNSNSGFGTSTAPSSGATGALALPRLVMAAIMDAQAGGSPTGLSFDTVNSQVEIGGGAFLTSMEDPNPPSGGESASATIVSTGWGAIIATVPFVSFTGTGTVASKKIALSGSGSYTPPAGIVGTGAIASKKAALAGAGTAGGATGTGTVHSKKIVLAGSGTGPVTGTGSIATRKAVLSGSGTAGGATGSGGIASKKAKPAGTGTYTAPVTGSGAIVSKKVGLAGAGSGPLYATGAVASKKVGLAGLGSVAGAIVGPGAVHSKKITLSGAGTAGGATAAGGVASKKVGLAGSGLGPLYATGTFHSKKILLTGSGTYSGPVIAAGAVASKKIILSGFVAYTPPVTGTGAFRSKKINLTALGIWSPPTGGISGAGAVVTKKVALFGTGYLGSIAVPGVLMGAPAPQMIPVYWGELSLNDGDRPDGLCTVVTDVEGWYGSPPLVGNDLDRALTDGAVYGFKTAGARVVTITGAAAAGTVDARGLLNQFARVLSGQAVERQPVALVIGEDQGADGLGSLTANVRADDGTLSLAWQGRTYFTYQVALTAGDPRLYEGNLRTAILTPLAAGTLTGRAYPWTPQRVYASSELSNDAPLSNDGSVPAPVLVTYNGPLSETRLTDGVSTIHMQPVGAGVTIYVESETLAATAPGGSTRASYLMAGSTPLLIPPFSDTTWSLYGTGTGTVTLAWRGAWG